MKSFKFSSNVLQSGKMNDEAMSAAHNSFRGLKYHASKFLFGEEVNKYFNEVNKAFAEFSTYQPLVNQENFNNEKYPEWVDIKYRALNKISSIPDEAPKIFSPYLYFGDIKSNF